MTNLQYSTQDGHFGHEKNYSRYPGKSVTLTRRDSDVSTKSSSAIKKSVSFINEPEVVMFVPQHSYVECGLEFPSMEFLRDHFERSHQREWVRCVICDKTLKHTEHFVI